MLINSVFLSILVILILPLEVSVLDISSLVFYIVKLIDI